MFAFGRLAKSLRAPSASAVTVVASTMNNQEIHHHQMEVRASFDDDSVVFSDANLTRFFLYSGILRVVVSF